MSNTGKAAWTFKTGSEVKSSPVVVGDKVLIGSYDAHLYALGAKDGKLAWKVQTEGYVHATPAVVDGIAYIAGCDEVLRAHPRRRRQGDVHACRRAPTPAPHRRFTTATPTTAPMRTKCWRSISTAKKIVWRYKHPQRNFPFYSSPAISGDRLFVGGRDKMLHALDLKTGKSLWTVMTRARIDSSPVVSGGSVYVGSSDGKLYVVDAATRQDRVRVRSRRPAHGVPRRCRRQARDRLTSLTASCSAARLSRAQSLSHWRESLARRMTL